MSSSAGNSRQWESLRIAPGLSVDASRSIPDHVHDLLTATSLDASEKASGYLRGVVVRQGSVYEAAEAFVELCLAEMEHGGITDCGMGDALDIIVEIVEGDPDPSETSLGNDAVVLNCVDAVRRHAPFLFEVAQTSRDELVVFGALELLNAAGVNSEAVHRLAGEAAARPLLRRSEWIHRSFLSMLASL